MQKKIIQVDNKNRDYCLMIITILFVEAVIVKLKHVLLKGVQAREFLHRVFLAKEVLPGQGLRNFFKN